MDSSPPGSSVHGILQLRILECGSSLGDLPDPGIEPGSLALQADSLPSELPGKPNAWPYLAAKEAGKCLRAGCKVAPGICY